MEDALIKIGIALVSGFIVFIVNKWYEKRQNRLRFIEYSITNSKNLLKDVQENVKLTIDNKPVSSLGVIQINVYNRTDKDYEDVHFGFELKNLKNPKAIVLPLHLAMDDPLRITNPPTTQRVDNLGQTNLSILNRNGNKPVVTVSITLEDIDNIECLVAVRKVGVMSKEINPHELTKPDVFKNKNIMIGLLFITTVAFFIGYIGAANNEKHWKGPVYISDDAWKSMSDEERKQIYENYNVVRIGTDSVVVHDLEH